ncbi:MAG TPA: hypothetical protein VHP11_12285 [Tepidisphaeraceae bacterium]|nr:hypothetical protein [Tepidisphaeraceae bacterium]
MPNGETPTNFRNIQGVLQELGIRWLTEELLTKFHVLAEKSLFSVSQMAGVFALANTPNALPQEMAEIWYSVLLQTAVEKALFPDPMPPSATTWEAMAGIWDEYIAYKQQFHLTGVQSFSDGDAWSIRGAVSAAWNIEFATVGHPVEIGPVVADSAHRAALRSAADLWTELSQYVNQATENPAARPVLWDSLLSRWCEKGLQQQSDMARAMLASELTQMRTRLGLTAQSPAPSATATAIAQASIGNVVVHNHILVPDGVGIASPTASSKPEKTTAAVSDDISKAKAVTPPAPEAVHNADFTMVKWYGDEYHFALGNQSAAVRALWEEWEKTGLGLHQETIRDAIDPERDPKSVFRMDTAFRDHLAFGTMIQRCGDGKYRLVPPSSSKAPATAKTKKSAGVRRNHA